MGSRFGGVKQVAAVDEAEHTLVDYAVYDAIRAGFDKVVCVVTPELEAAFHERVGRNIARHVELVYAHQCIPQGRTKPWGTGEAVLVALPHITGCFATINADDYYGWDAYHLMANFLSTGGDSHAVIGYWLRNTMSPNGTVSRGICEVRDGYLTGISERTGLQQVCGGAIDDRGDFFQGDTLVSMNFWGFRPSAAQVFRDEFDAFLEMAAPTAEFYLPDVGGSLESVRLLPTTAAWLGVTYAEDLPDVRSHLAHHVEQGEYPQELWS